MGKFLLEAEEPHKCPLPGIRAYTGLGTLRHPGTIWQCDCGKYYIVKGKSWRQISERKARKLIKTDGLV